MHSHSTVVTCCALDVPDQSLCVLRPLCEKGFGCGIYRAAVK